MIRNVIFDFGQVLIRFDGKEITSHTVTNQTDANFVSDVFFDRRYWDKIDTGELSGDSLIAAVKERLPLKYHAFLPEIFYTWVYRYLIFRACPRSWKG